MGDFSRLASGMVVDVVSTAPPFSNFQYVDHHFRAESLRRLFSLARREDGKTLVVETIGFQGATADEHEFLLRLFSDYQCEKLLRLTFWKKVFTSWPDAVLADNDLIGYAIVRCDCVPSADVAACWHVFEAVFRKYSHHHNCVPCARNFKLACGDRRFICRGTMYCQQNGLSKACAQVALRSLLVNQFPEDDILYSKIHDLARGDSELCPKDGLGSGQIRRVFTGYGLEIDEVDYLNSGVSHEDIPYSSFAYAGIENGMGALVGFELAGSSIDKTDPGRHIIPYFGHTFNQDTWVPKAYTAYFHVGDDTKYLSSLEWMSSFIGHDDNFGANFCIPRKFIEPQQVNYVVAIRPRHAAYGAVMAEAIAVDFLYSAAAELAKNLETDSNNYWGRQLYGHIEKQDVVLRTIHVSRDRYIEHLQQVRDWESHAEIAELVETLGTALPEWLWVIEVSIPELFAANYRKLGELVLDAGVSVLPYPPHDKLLWLGRFPGLYLINCSQGDQIPGFTNIPSNLRSHVSLCYDIEPLAKA